MGKIFKTTNGGTTWTIQWSGTTNYLHSVYFTNANSGYTVGDDGTILKTTDGGTVGIYEKQKTSNLKIYPNPATEVYLNQETT